MISKDFFKHLEVLAHERGISKEKILEVMKKGFESAYKKTYDDATKIRVDFSEDKNKIQVFAQWEVVSEYDEDRPTTEQLLLADAKLKKRTARIGEVIENEVTPKDFGRIAALTAKQVLVQGLKNIEREQAYDAFKEKEFEMITAKVTNFNNGYYTLDLGEGAVTSLPEKELLPTDIISVGDNIKVYISKVEMTPKGPKIFVSRIDAKLVSRLLEQVVPELVDGTVEIVGMSRDAGDRCKIGIKSNDENVDCLGACLGRRGERIKDVVKWLNGEKIDLFRFSEDPQELIANSLQPSQVISVIITSEKNKEAIAIVPNDQLSLAIGKKGQNVRLAVNAINWKIDIKSVTQAMESGIDF